VRPWSACGCPARALGAGQSVRASSEYGLHGVRSADACRTACTRAVVHWGASLLLWVLRMQECATEADSADA